MQIKQEKRHRRHKRIRARIKGTKDCPRISVFRSNKHIFVQLIDDDKGKTLVSSNNLEIKTKNKLTKIEMAKEIGKEIAKKALAQKIKKAVFDRGGYKYHGRVKAVAEGVRQGGIKF